MDVITYAILKKKIESGISADLKNYYKKSETYNRTEINDLVSTIPTFAIKVVDILPVENISLTTIYLLKITPQSENTKNLFEEYIYVENKWELLGAQSFDLTGYATEEWINQQGFRTQSQVEADILANIVANNNEFSDTILRSIKVGDTNYKIDTPPAFLLETNDIKQPLALTAEQFAIIKAEPKLIIEVKYTQETAIHSFMFTKVAKTAENVYMFTSYVFSNLVVLSITEENGQVQGIISIPDTTVTSLGADETDNILVLKNINNEDIGTPITIKTINTQSIIGGGNLELATPTDIQNKADKTYVDQEFNKVAYIQDYTNPQLAAPKVTVKDSSLSWNMVRAANQYIIKIDNVEKTRIKETQINLNDYLWWTELPEKFYNVAVIAHDTTGKYPDSNATTSSVERVTLGNLHYDSWETISANMKSGVGATRYNLGEIKKDKIHITKGPLSTQDVGFGQGIYEAVFKLVDKKRGRYDTASGTSNAVFEIQNLIGTSSNSGIAWNANNQASTFAASDIFKELNTEVVKYLPTGLQTVLENTTVYSNNATGAAGSATVDNVVPATGKLFLPCYYELFGQSFGFATNDSETINNSKAPQGMYEYYNNNNNGQARIKKKIEVSQSYYYWLRSPYSAYSAGDVGSDGSWDYYSYHNSNGRVAPCFTL